MAESANDLDRRQVTTGSGRFRKWSVIPGALVESMLALERTVPLPVRKPPAFRMIVVLEGL